MQLLVVCSLQQVDQKVQAMQQQQHLARELVVLMVVWLQRTLQPLLLLLRQLWAAAYHPCVGCLWCCSSRLG
jgi:hypothetical protein